LKILSERFAKNATKLFAWYSTMYYIRGMRTRKLQSKVEPELEDHVKKQPDYQGMSDYIRIAIKQKSKFKPKKEAV